MAALWRLMLSLLLSSITQAQDSQDGQALDQLGVPGPGQDSLRLVAPLGPLTSARLRPTATRGSAPRGSARRLRRADADDFRSSSSSSDPTLADLERIDVPQSQINETWEAQNRTVAYDSQPYYEQTVGQFNTHWVDLDALRESGQHEVHEHPLLSKSYRRADTVTLSFHFPYYGHLVDKVTIATGGFLYLGKYVHSWLAATQYVAPLMAHFDTSTDEEAKIRYVDDGDSFTVEWSRVHLKTREDETVNGTSTDSPGDPQPFTFQAILHKNGDIAFAYKEIPFNISLIEDSSHPVKVGLSDAYIMDRVIFFVRRKTIYEYHRLSLHHDFVGNETAIFFRALPTCNQMTHCSQCLGEEVQGFQCQWCPSSSTCSDGIDRGRQEWLTLGCNHRNVNESRFCDLPLAEPEDHPFAPDTTFRSNDDIKTDPDDGSVDGSNSQESEIIGSKGGQYHFALSTLTVILVVALLLFVWVIYAYFFPHSWSGQLLIKYRPTRWHWLRSEPRYTAASIHM